MCSVIPVERMKPSDLSFASSVINSQVRLKQFSILLFSDPSSPSLYATQTS